MPCQTPRETHPAGRPTEDSRFNLGDGQDVLTDRGSQSGRYAGIKDRLYFGEGVDEESLWFTRDGNHLDIHLLGSAGDRVQVQNWFSSGIYQVEEIHTDDAVITNTQVQTLVQAMAAFGAPSAGEIHLTEDQQNQVISEIAAAWQPA